MFIGLKQWIWEDPTGKIVSLENAIVVCNMVQWYLLYDIKYFGSIPTIIHVCALSHTLNNVQFLVIDMSK